MFIDLPANTQLSKYGSSKHRHFIAQQHKCTALITFSWSWAYSTGKLWIADHTFSNTRLYFSNCYSGIRLYCL